MVLRRPPIQIGDRALSEKSEAKRDGTKLQHNSGRGQYSKGDGIRPLFVVDYKEASKSFTINEEVWAKVCTDAYKVNRDKQPQLRIVLGTGDNKVRLSLIATDMCDELEEEYVDKYE